MCDEALAQYLIKDTNDYYCEDCAIEWFGDLGMLISVEKQAHHLKEMIDAVVIKKNSLPDLDDSTLDSSKHLAPDELELLEKSDSSQSQDKESATKNTDPEKDDFAEDLSQDEEEQ